MTSAGYMGEDQAARAKEKVGKPAWLDGIRYQIPSSTTAGETYLCELHLYNGNGVCQCRWFVRGLEKWLKRGYDGARALAEGKTKLIYDGQRPEESLMCKHLIEGHWKFERDTMAAIVENIKQHAHPENPH